MKNKITPLLLLVAIGLNAQNAHTKQPLLDTASLDKIIASMTLEEKAQLLVGDHEFEKYKLRQIADLVCGVAGTSPFGIPLSLYTNRPAGVNIDATHKRENKTYYYTGFPITILLIWQPGIKGGNSVVDVITGKLNLSGKLSAIFPNDYMDIGSSAQDISLMTALKVAKKSWNKPLKRNYNIKL